MMNAVISLASFFLRMTGVPAEVALEEIDALPTRSTELSVPSCLSRCHAGLCSIAQRHGGYCYCFSTLAITDVSQLNSSFSDSSSNMLVQA